MNEINNFDDDELTIENLIILESNETIKDVIDTGYISDLNNTEDSDINEDISKLTFSSGFLKIFLLFSFIF